MNKIGRLGTKTYKPAVKRYYDALFIGAKKIEGGLKLYLIWGKIALVYALLGVSLTSNQLILIQYDLDLRVKLCCRMG